jgi:hypothetical protein
MKRVLFLLPLLTLSAVGSFAAPYLDGAGAFPRGSGFLVGAVCMFILPWVVSGLFVVAAKTRIPVRLAIFISTLAVQPALLFAFTPPSATSEMMGIAHRLGREFSADELRDSANQLRSKFQAGTLRTTSKAREDYFEVAAEAVVVPQTELPIALREHFKRVYIQHGQAGGGCQVVFALAPDTGIICDNRKQVHEFFVYSIADGVHAYRYQRL